MSSERLDAALVTRGLVRSRAVAKDLIADGVVTVGGNVQTKPSTKVGPDDDVALTRAPERYVGRAAHKLLAALEAFDGFRSAIEGAYAVDVGASTGGFTQVLLENGAAHVVALDVGHGQLAAPVRDDPRVTNLEGLNIRDVIGTDQIAGQPFDVVVSDLSFISLTLALAHMGFLLAPHGHMVVLVKPQFEVGRERLGRTGVVSSREQRRESVEKVIAAARGVGLTPWGLAWSPMVGSHGNHEYVLCLRWAAQGEGLDAATLTSTIDELTRRSDA